MKKVAFAVGLTILALSLPVAAVPQPPAGPNNFACPEIPDNCTLQQKAVNGCWVCIDVQN